MLVLLVTQGQYYVTDERTGSRHALTTARLGTFCKGATGDALRSARARDLAALAYEGGSGGVQSFEVAVHLMYRALRAGHHDAIVWVRLARRSGRVA